ncbi:MAG TPA: CHASE3 domain-containing protein, partial [Kofleriaceae bacterium]
MQVQATERRSKAILPPKALAALIGALAAALVIAVLSYRSLITRTAAADAVQHTQLVASELNQLQAVITDGETGQRGYLLTGADRYLGPSTAARNRWPGLLAVLRQLTRDNGEQQQRIAELEPILDSKFAELDDTIRLERKHDHAAALEIVNSDRGKELMDRGRDLIIAMLGSERDLLATRSAAWEASVTTSAYVVFGGVAVLILMIILIGVLASRDYRTVSNEAWVRNIQASLVEQMQGDVRLESLGDNVLRTLARKLGAPVGAMYVVEGKQLRRIAQTSLEDGTDPVRKLGDGMIGEVAQRDTTVHIDHLPDGYLKISSALGETKPVALAIAPAVVDGQVVAVTELAFMKPLDALEKSALDRVSGSIGTAIRSAKDRNKLEELLEETQHQAEELQTQQEELRVSNEELEQQSRALQLSQSQLENQQAELEQINAQLEEQAQSLARQRDDLARAGA